MKKLRGQISESRRLAILLAVSGGFMDAYTYTFRGEVFANAQTGNIILLAINLSEGNFEKMLQYLFPVIAFAFGIILAEIVHRFCTIDNILHWRQYTVLLECIILFSVGFISQEYNMIANSLVSFACGIQVESFRKVKAMLRQPQCASATCVQVHKIYLILFLIKIKNVLENRLYTTELYSSLLSERLLKML